MSLSQVLIDGSHVLQAVGSDKSYYGQTLKLAKKAGKGIYHLGGAVAGAVWTGATYITGGQAEGQDQGGNEVVLNSSGRISNPTTSRLFVDSSTGASSTASKGGSTLSYEERELQKDLDAFVYDEIFMEKYLNQLTLLEKEFLKNIAFTESQSKNHVKLSESFGKLGNIQKIASAPGDNQNLEDGDKLSQANSAS